MEQTIISKMVVLDEHIDDYPDFAVIKVTAELKELVRGYAEACVQFGCDRISRFNYVPQYMVERDGEGLEECDVTMDDLREWEGRAECDMIDVSKTHFRWSAYIKHTNIKILTGDIPLAEIGIDPAMLGQTAEEPGALTRDGESGTDYTLAPGQTSVWVSVDNISAYITRNDEGVAVDLFAKGGEDNPPMGSTWATFAEAEPADDEFRCAGCGKIRDVDDSIKGDGKHGDLYCPDCIESSAAGGEFATAEDHFRCSECGVGVSMYDADAPAPLVIGAACPVCHNGTLEPDESDDEDKFRCPKCHNMSDVDLAMTVDGVEICHNCVRDAQAAQPRGYTPLLDAGFTALGHCNKR